MLFAKRNAAVVRRVLRRFLYVVSQCKRDTQGGLITCMLKPLQEKLYTVDCYDKAIR